MSENKLFAALREDTKRKKGKGSETVRIVLVVGIILLFGWNIFFVDWDDSKDAALKKSIDAEMASMRRGSVDEPDEATGEKRPGMQARRIISGIRNQGGIANSSALFAQANNFVNSGENADAYLLHFYLAKQGYGPSAMALAEMADPGYHDAKKSFLEKPDFSQAHKWYIQALMLGEEKADKRLAELKLRVKAAAAGGNEDARRLLVGW